MVDIRRRWFPCIATPKRNVRALSLLALSYVKYKKLLQYERKLLSNFEKSGDMFVDTCRSMVYNKSNTVIS